MAVSPGSTTLYRTGPRAVILAGCLFLAAQIVSGQSASHKSSPRGPRALALLELGANGKARLIPVTILYDGEFYDASAYKASPVPMALESGTVYEAVKTGFSQGLFTVTRALQTKNTWIGTGTWQSAAELAAAAAKKRTVSPQPRTEPEEGPPVLRRGGAPPPKPTESGQGSPPASPPGLSTTAPTPVPAKPSPAPAEENDPDRPVLRRGPQPPEKTETETATPPPANPSPKEPAAKTAASGSKQLIPAISDADGPEPQPYAYTMKPDEEQKLRKHMLALAAGEVRTRAAQLAAEIPSLPPAARASRKSGARSKPSQLGFEDVQMHVFDLSNSNEPVMVLTAKSRMPSRPGVPAEDRQYLIALVARQDIYGELHQDFVSLTDTQHLDVLPRLDFIDAVDADGDGRGELLFRETSDAGSGFVLYRVVGDRLWLLFEGNPGE